MIKFKWIYTQANKSSHNNPFVFAYTHTHTRTHRSKWTNP